MEYVLIKGCRSKIILRKKNMLKITRNLNYIIYVDIEMQDIMKEFYLIKRNFMT